MDWPTASNGFSKRQISTHSKGILLRFLAPDLKELILVAEIRSDLRGRIWAFIVLQVAYFDRRASLYLDFKTGIIDTICQPFDGLWRWQYGTNFFLVIILVLRNYRYFFSDLFYNNLKFTFLIVSITRFIYSWHLTALTLILIINFFVCPGLHPLQHLLLADKALCRVLSIHAWKIPC